MNLQQEIKKAECKLAKLIYKYTSLLALGIKRDCLEQNIKTLIIFINALKGFKGDCKCECDIKGQYTFELPNGNLGYVEFDCNNNMYITANGSTTKVIYDYYNNLVNYSNGDTEIVVTIRTLFNTIINSLEEDMSITVWTDDFGSPIYEKIGGFQEPDILGQFINDFNLTNTLGLILVLNNSNLIVLNSDQSDINITINLLSGELQFQTTQINIEEEISIYQNINIEFDECCNVIGDFNFNLYCIGKVEIDLEGVTSGPFAGTITIGSYVLGLTTEMLLNLDLLKQAWNTQYGNDIYLDYEGNELIFYSLYDLEFCSENQNIVVNILKGEFASATALIEVPLATGGNPACTIIDLNYSQFSNPNLKHGIFYNGQYLYTWHFSEIININTFLEDFNNLNDSGLTAELFSTTPIQIPILSIDGSTIDIYINNSITPIFQTDSISGGITELNGDISDLFTTGTLIEFKISSTGFVIFSVTLEEDVDWIGLIALYNQSPFGVTYPFTLINTDPIENTYTFELILEETKYNYQIKICSENTYPQEDFNGNTIEIISYQDNQSRLKVQFNTLTSDWTVGTGLITISSSCDGLIFATTEVYSSFEDFVNDFNTNNNLGYFMDYFNDTNDDLNVIIYSNPNNNTSINCDIEIVSNKSEVGFYEDTQTFLADTVDGTLSGGVNSYVYVQVNNFGGEFYADNFTTIQDFIDDFNNNDQGAFIEIIGTTDDNYILQITSPPGSAFNGTLWFIIFNKDEKLEFISDTAEGGSNPNPDVFEGEFNENWITEKLINIEPCDPEIINCLTEEEIKLILNKLGIKQSNNSTKVTIKILADFDKNDFDSNDFDT